MIGNKKLITLCTSRVFEPQIHSYIELVNEELKKHGISVTAVCPGPVNTEFFDVAEQHNANFNFKKYFMSKADKVVRKALVDAYHRKSVSVYSLAMNGFRLLMKIFPHELVLRVMTLLQNGKII